MSDVTTLSRRSRERGWVVRCKSRFNAHYYSDHYDQALSMKSEDLGTVEPGLGLCFQRVFHAISSPMFNAIRHVNHGSSMTASLALYFHTCDCVIHHEFVSVPCTADFRSTILPCLCCLLFPKPSECAAARRTRIQAGQPFVVQHDVLSRFLSYNSFSSFPPTCPKKSQFP